MLKTKKEHHYVSYAPFLNTENCRLCYKVEKTAQKVQLQTPSFYHRWISGNLAINFHTIAFLDNGI
jgi:hypothetical protein